MAKRQERFHLIAYRPGSQLGSWIADHAGNWNLSLHDAARRLAALACCQLGPDSHADLLRNATAKAEATGGEADFIAACAEAKATLSGMNRERGEGRQLNAEERAELVRRLADEAVAAQQQRRRGSM